NVVLTPLAPASTRVLDSAFETPDVSQQPGGLLYNPTGTAWTFSPQSGTNGSGIAANGSEFNNPKAPEGTQVAFLQGRGSITHTVNPDAGTYTLNFQAAQRPGNQQTFQVLVDGNVVGPFQPASTSFQAYTTGSFTVTAGSHTIEFLGTNTNSPDNTADNT